MRKLGPIIAGGAMIFGMSACGGEDNSIAVTAEVGSMGMVEDVQIVHDEWERVTGQDQVPRNNPEDIRNVEAHTTTECRPSTQANFITGDDLSCLFDSNCFWMSEDEYCREFERTRYSFGLRHVIVDRVCDLGDILHEQRPTTPDRDQNCIDAIPLRDDQYERGTIRYLMRVLGVYDADPAEDVEDLQTINQIVSVSEDVYAHSTPRQSQVELTVNDDGVIIDVTRPESE